MGFSTTSQVVGAGFLNQPSTVPCCLFVTILIILPSTLRLMGFYDNILGAEMEVATCEWKMLPNPAEAYFSGKHVSEANLKRKK